MKVKSWLVTITSVMLVIAGLAAFKVQQIQAAIAFAESFPEHSETVEAEIVQAQPYQNSIRLTATVVAPKRIALRTEEAGRITKLPFKPGSEVKTGDLILQLDVSQEQAQLEANQARLNLAKSLYQRGVRLKKAKALSQEEVDRRYADMKVLEADIAALNSQINKKSIFASFDGVLGLYNLELGQYLAPSTEVTTLIAKQPSYWADFDLPQFYQSLAIGSKVELAAIQQNAQANTQWVAATVIAQQQEVTRQSLSVRYRVSFERQALNAKHDMLLAVKVPIGEQQSLVKLNKQALQQDQLGQFVYLLERDKSGNGYRAVRRDITIESQNATELYVASGLDIGAVIASKGAFKLHPGVLVYIADQKQAGEQAGEQTNNDQASGGH